MFGTQCVWAQGMFSSLSDVLLLVAQRRKLWLDGEEHDAFRFVNAKERSVVVDGVVDPGLMEQVDAHDSDSADSEDFLSDVMPYDDSDDDRPGGVPIDAVATSKMRRNNGRVKARSLTRTKRDRRGRVAIRRQEARREAHALRQESKMRHRLTLRTKSKVGRTWCRTLCSLNVNVNEVSFFQDAVRVLEVASAWQALKCARRICETRPCTVNQMICEVRVRAWKLFADAVVS